MSFLVTVHGTTQLNQRRETQEGEGLGIPPKVGRLIRGAAEVEKVGAYRGGRPAPLGG